MMTIQSCQSRFPFAHTFSIVARDPISGQMGVAVQSHWFSVGSIVAWGQAGVGVVASQAMAEVSYGPLGLEGMAAGETAPQVLERLLTFDEGRQLRQVAMVDSEGNVAVHTGERCIAACGHVQGDGFSVQANMMVNDGVWPAMDRAYRGNQGDLAGRLLYTLEAAQAVGGDIRGQQSAALLVVGSQRTGKPWEGRIVDLRVEDHSDPLGELRRLLNIQRAYTFMNQGDEYLGQARVDDALAAYCSAAALAPEMLELPFWHAVTLADLGRVDEALAIFKPIFLLEPQWRELLKRLPAAGLLREDPQMMDKLIST
jgi:uncharacterized Ntn-hydrolase superfamily protein